MCRQCLCWVPCGRLLQQGVAGEELESSAIHATSQLGNLRTVRKPFNEHSGRLPTLLQAVS